MGDAPRGVAVFDDLDTIADMRLPRLHLDHADVLAIVETHADVDRIGGIDRFGDQRIDRFNHASDRRFGFDEVEALKAEQGGNRGDDREADAGFLGPVRCRP
jgi:glyoxylase-like metal-dependent hydrolase (beta-lactamase superfamily II)